MGAKTFFFVRPARAALTVSMNLTSSTFCLIPRDNDIASTKGSKYIFSPTLTL